MESSISELESQKNYLSYYKDLVLVDVRWLIDRTLSKLNDTLLDYNIECCFSNKDVQRLFLNYFIIEVTDCLKKCNSIKTTIFVLENEHIDNKHVIGLSKRGLNGINACLYCINTDFKEFFKKINEKDIDCLVDIEKIYNSSCKVNRNFTKIKSFLQRNHLNYLLNEYFCIPSNKIILFR